ncbi:MAG: ABC transporter substrate-binding protein [Anaerolineales bacterium]|jgi:acyl-CoA hydrolase/ABC-type branched-subunit amino acid transport system substrate-binding protein
MTPKELYKQKLVSIPEAVSLVQSHQTIAVALAGSEPPGLLTELGKHKDRLEDVTVWIALPLREYDFVYKPEMTAHFFVENWFYGAPDRAVHPQGRISYIPNNLHQAAKVRLEAAGNKLDIFWGTATPPDTRGYVSLSLGIVYEKYLIERADLVVLEINDNLPWTLGDTQVHISDVDYLVENHVPLFVLPVTPPTDWEQAIGGYVAELIEDGSTLQLGIGGIPNAITAYLMERRDLGIHTEMYIDGMVDLYDAGVINGKRKTYWKGKMVGAFALGTKKLYDFVDNNLAVEFQQGKVTNDPFIIGQNYKMVSVNTALQVDLYGQVCSQSLGPRHFSGTGGQLDTHRGAQLSPNGRGVIALHSAVKDNTISTIVPMLTEGAQVTVASQDIDTVVTEYGVAQLKGLSVKERTDALIKIAHPDFRHWLREEAERLEIVPRLVVPGIEVLEAPAETTAPGVTAQTIRLGTFCDLSGPNASIGMAALRGYSAYYEHVNHWGGVHGRRIELIVEDDGFDPSRTQAAVEKLVTQDEVFAIVSPLGTITNLAVLDYLLEKQVPVISPHSGLSIWSTPLKRTYFALQPSYRVEGRILAQYTLNAIQPKRIAVFAVADQFGEEGSTAFVEELARSGVEPVGIVTHPAGETAPEAWVAELAAHEPDVVLLYTYLKPVADLLLAAHGRGFHPSWLGSYVISGPDLFRFAGAEATHGLRAASYPKGPRYHRGEGLYLKLMTRKYADETPGAHNRIGYAASQLVVEGLRIAGPKLTRAGFIAALEGIKDWTGGLLPPIRYSAADHRGLTALAMTRALHGRWLVEEGSMHLKE